MNKLARCYCVLPILLCACASPALHTVERTRVMMDTAVIIKVFLPDSTGEPQAATAIAAVFAELERLDSLMSSYRADSEVAVINRAAGMRAPGAFNHASHLNEIGISTDVDSVIRAAQYVSACTEGAFDITIAPVLRLWGFGTDSLAVPPVAAITS
ncbi:FAD:protein FMN transferase, partial [candidate division KSB1 bacterium]|nr:FAD:protein FMN transferase [candidate division KSB1 bacterium]